MYDFFARPGFGYNLASALVAVVGTVLGLVGLAVAYRQLVKTRRAAEAAKRAAESTAADLQRVAAIVDVQRLSSYCREVRAFLASHNLATVSRALHDIRTGLNQLRSTAPGRPLHPQAEWDRMIAAVAEVQSRVDAAPAGEYDELLGTAVNQVVTDLDGQSHAMTARVTVVRTGGR